MLRRLLGRIYRGVTTASRSPLRPVFEAVRFSRRMRGVRPGLRALRDLPPGAPLELSLFEDIRHAWGNPAWTADAGFLREVAASVRSRPGPVLDCGSGLSTLVSATISASRGGIVWSLEQDRSWYEYMERMIEALGFDNVRLFYTPLRTFDEFAWFDVEDLTLPSHFPVVSVDGPAVVRSAFPPDVYAAWRVGVVPLLLDRGISWDEILLDDVEDTRSPALAERWRRRGIPTTEIDTPTGKLLKGPGPAT